MNLSNYNYAEKFKNSIIFLLKFSNSFFCFTNILLNSFKNNFGFLFFSIKNLSLNLEKENSDNLALIQLSQYYSLQNFPNLSILDSFFYILDGNKIKFNFNKKLIDLFLQNIYGKFLKQSKFNKNVFYLKNFNSTEKFLQKKWVIVFKLGLLLLILSKNKIYCFLLRKLKKNGRDQIFLKLIFKNINERCVLSDLLSFRTYLEPYLNLKQLDSILKWQDLNLNIFKYGDVYLRYIFEEFHKFKGIIFKESKLSPKVSISWILNYYSDKLLFSSTFICFFVPNSFFYERLAFFSLSKISKKLLDLNVISSLSFISRGLLIRLMVFHKFTQFKRLKKKAIIEDYILIFSKKNYIILKYLIFFYFENFSKVSFFPSNKTSNEKSILLIQKVKIILFGNILDRFNYEKYIDLFIYLIVLKKKFFIRKKILLISHFFYEKGTRIIFHSSNFFKKFNLICLYAMDFALGSNFLHENIYSHNIYVLKKEVGKNFLRNQKKNFKNIKHECFMIQKIKKKIFNFKKEKKSYDFKKILSTEERYKFRIPRYIGQILNKCLFNGINVFCHLKMKISFRESEISLYFFLKGSELFFFSNASFNIHKKKNLESNQYKKLSKTFVKFHFNRYKIRKRVYGVCLFCFTKKKKKIKLFFRLLRQNFYSFNHIYSKPYRRFSVFNNLFGFLAKIFNNSFFSLSTKPNFTSFLRFSKNNKIFLKKILKNLNLNRKKKFSNSFFQNLFFFSLNYFNIIFDISWMKYRHSINFFKTTFATKISIFFSPKIEYIQHKNWNFLKKTKTFQLKKILSISKDVGLEFYFTEKKIKKKENLNFRIILEDKKITSSVKKDLKKKEIIHLIKMKLINFSKHLFFLKNKKFKNKFFNLKKNIPKNFGKKPRKKISKIVSLYTIFSNPNQIFNNFLFCKFLKCTNYIDYNLDYLYQTSKIIFDKIKSEIFILSIKFFLPIFLEKKRIIRLRNYIWKYSKNSLDWFRISFKNNKFFKEFMIIDDNCSYFLLYLIVYLVFFKKMWKIFFKVEQKYSFEIHLSKFSKNKFNSFLIDFLRRICGGEKKQIFFYLNFQYFFCNLIKVLNLSKFHFLLFELKFKKIEKNNKKTSILSKIQTKNKFRSGFLFFLEKKFFITLLFQKFIFFGEKLNLKFILDLLYISIKNHPLNMVLNYWKDLFFSKDSFLFLKKRIDFIVNYVFVNPKFKIFDFVRWIYQSFVINLKSNFIFKSKNTVQSFEFEKKQKGFHFKKKKFPILFSKKSSENLLKTNTFILEKKNLISCMCLSEKMKMKKIQKNENFIFKNKNNILSNANQYLNFRSDSFYTMICNCKTTSSKIIEFLIKKFNDVFKNNKNAFKTNEYLSFLVSNKRKKFFLIFMNEFFLENNTITFNSFLVNFFVHSIRPLIRNNFVKKEVSDFPQKTKNFFFFNLYNYIHSIKTDVWKKKNFFENFFSDSKFFSHLFFKSLKNQKKISNYFKFLSPNKIFLIKKKNQLFFGFHGFFFNQNFSLIKCISKIELLNTIIFYKKIVLDLIIRKNTKLKNAEILLKVFYLSVSQFNHTILLKLNFKLKTLKVYLRRFMHSKNINFQNFAVHFISKHVDLNLKFFFDRWIFLKFVFIEIFNFIIKSKRITYPFVLKLLYKNLIPSRYFKHVFKILKNLLIINLCIFRKNCQIYTCFIVLLTRCKSFSKFSKHFDKEIFGFNIFKHFGFFSSMFSLLFSLFFLGLNLKILNNRLYEFSTIFFRNKTYENKFGLCKIFFIFLRKIENNRLNFFAVQNNKKTCLCSNKNSIFKLKEALRFKILSQIKKKATWCKSLKLFCEKIKTVIEFHKFPKIKLDNFHIYNSFLCEDGIQIDNYSMISNDLNKIFSFFIENSMLYNALLGKTKIYKIPLGLCHCLISYPSFLKSNEPFILARENTNEKSKHGLNRIRIRVFSEKLIFFLSNLTNIVRNSFSEKNIPSRFCDVSVKKKETLYTNTNNFLNKPNRLHLDIFFIHKILEILNSS